MYNDCPGEFSLSREALQWLSSRGVTQAYKILEEIEKIPGVSVDETMIGMTRHHPLLALCVRELGKQASGDHAFLRVRTITSSKYLIRNVGGIETVLTPEEIKWVLIKE